MNKQELIKKISAITHQSQVQVQDVVNGFISVVSNALANGDKVAIANFLTLDTKYVADKIGRNPKTGEVIKIMASQKIIVRAGKVLKYKINRVRNAK